MLVMWLDLVEIGFLKMTAICRGDLKGQFERIKPGLVKPSLACVMDYIHHLYKYLIRLHSTVDLVMNKHLKIKKTKNILNSIFNKNCRVMN